MGPDSPFRGRDSPSNLAEWQKGLLCVPVHFGLSSFVEAYLQTNRVPQGLPGHTILMYALGLKITPNYPGTFVLLKQPASPDVVDLLLQHGEIRINRLYVDPILHGCISSSHIGSKAPMGSTAKSTSEDGLSSPRAC